MSLDGELNALKHQNYSKNVIPFIQIVKDIKKKNSKASILADIKEIIQSKPDNNFFITVPRNLNLSKKQLKNPVQTFFEEINKNDGYHLNILNQFGMYPNVIPVMEVDLEKYTPGDLLRFKNGITTSSKSFCYRIEAKHLNLIKTELYSLITKDDYLIYDLNDMEFSKNSVKNEIKELYKMKLEKGFRTIVIKQIYKELTFPKYPDGLITLNSDAFDCIDFDFYADFKTQHFDYFGDWAGIRNNPIYGGGLSYPSYLTIEMDNFNHHGFKGIEKDVNSYRLVLNKYVNSLHWTNKLTKAHKDSCYGCEIIQNFNLGLDNSVNATKWKAITVSHFLDTMDYKIENSII